MTPWLLHPAVVVAKAAVELVETELPAAAVVISTTPQAQRVGQMEGPALYMAVVVVHPVTGNTEETAAPVVAEAMMAAAVAEDLAEGQVTVAEPVVMAAFTEETAAMERWKIPHQLPLRKMVENSTTRSHICILMELLRLTAPRIKTYITIAEETAAADTVEKEASAAIPRAAAVAAVAATAVPAAMMHPNGAVAAVAAATAAMEETEDRITRLLPVAAAVAAAADFSSMEATPEKILYPTNMAAQAAAAAEDWKTAAPELMAL